MILRILVIFLSLFIHLNVIGQTSFEKGYFVEKDGNTTQCLIKDMGWGISPEKFTYKINEADTPITLDAKDVKEFGITDDQIFYSFLLLADLTRIDASSISLEKKKQLKQTTLFLFPLILGEISLYEYKHNATSIFFVQNGNEIPRQLISKPYYKDSGWSKPIYYNQSYINTLWTAYRCGNMTTSELEKVAYKRKDLTNYFKAYNTCKEYDYEVIKEQKKRKLGTWSFTVTPGVSLVTVYAEDIFKYGSRAEFDSKMVGRLGIEAEFLHFRQKWALFVEGSYQKFEGEKLVELLAGSVNQPDGEVLVFTKYSTIEFPIGLRYYIYLNKDARFFISGGAKIFELMNEGFVDTVNSSLLNFPLSPGPNIFASVGFQLKNKFRVDFKYDFKRDIANSSIGNTAIYNAFSIIGGFTF